jgi:hypothetical protein
MNAHLCSARFHHFLQQKINISSSGTFPVFLSVCLGLFFPFLYLFLLILFILFYPFSEHYNFLCVLFSSSLFFIVFYFCNFGPSFSRMFPQARDDSTPKGEQQVVETCSALWLLPDCVIATRWTVSRCWVTCPQLASNCMSLLCDVI